MPVHKSNTDLPTNQTLHDITIIAFLMAYVKLAHSGEVGPHTSGHTVINKTIGCSVCAGKW